VILVIDNYDSFTYNLVQEIGRLGQKMRVFRNDKISVDQIRDLRPSHLVISPGPGRPEHAGISVEAIRAFSQSIPILGVCLGHQAMGIVSGARVDFAPRLMHGKPSPIHHDGKDLFRNLPNPFPGGRYHSLVVVDDQLPDKLEITARTAEGEIMGLRFRGTCCVGVQFHPESVLTPDGQTLIRNFLEAPRVPC